MQEIKQRIEKNFIQFSKVLYRHRIKTLVFMFFVVAVQVGQLPKLTVDTSTEGLLHSNDPKRIELNKFRDQFGQDNFSVIIIHPPEVFDDKFFTKLKSLHNDLENELPYVKEVSSLINARSTRVKDDVLYVQDLLEEWPEKEADWIELKNRVMQNPVYLNHFISEDGNYTAILIESEALILSGNQDDVLSEFEDAKSASEEHSESRHYFSERENHEVAEAIYRVADRYRSSDFLIALSGVPIVVDIFNQTVIKDMRFLLVLATFIVIFFLAILFRRFTGVFLPEIVVFSSLFSTMGLMAVFNIPLKSTSVILPCFLVSVGVADAVHILVIFYRRLDDGENKEDALYYAMGHSGPAILMTSLTTSAGLLSFSFSELSAISELGVFSAVGVTIALVYTIFMLPPLISLIPIKPRQNHRTIKTTTMDRVLLSFAHFSTIRYKKILWISTIIFICSAIFLFKLKLSHNVMKFFPDSMQVKKDVLLLDEKLKGAISIEVVFDTGKVNGIYEPDLLNRIEIFTKKLEKYKTEELFVGKIFSINDIIKEMHQALNDNDPSFYLIPQERDIIAQEFLLFENSGTDDLERIVDRQYTKTRMTIKIPWVDNFVMENFIIEIEKELRRIFTNTTEYAVTGVAPLLVNATSNALRSMLKSYGIAFIVISLMMVVLVGDLKFGLISMIPNLFPIFIVMGFIGFADIPLDLNSLMIGSIAIGLVVDDTMHFMYNFRKFYDLSGDTFFAVRETLMGTGRAMLITSLVLSASFFTLLLATMKSSNIFGFFTGVVILLALLSDFILAPALMMVATHSKPLEKGSDSLAKTHDAKIQN